MESPGSFPLERSEKVCLKLGFDPYLVYESQLIDFARDQPHLIGDIYK
jgi:hypothetical protein